MAQVRYQIVARGEQYGSSYGAQRYDIPAETQEQATEEARQAYGKRTGLANSDITIEIVGRLDAEGHDVARPSSQRRAHMTVDELRAALAGEKGSTPVMLIVGEHAGWLAAVRPDIGGFLDLVTEDVEPGE